MLSDEDKAWLSQRFDQICGQTSTRPDQSLVRVEQPSVKALDLSPTRSEMRIEQTGNRLVTAFANMASRISSVQSSHSADLDDLHAKLGVLSGRVKKIDERLKRVEQRPV